MRSRVTRRRLRSPPTGVGESDGPGTYRHFKDLGTQRRLKFDGTKRPR